MAKDTYYFPHDYEPTADPKIQAMIGEYGAAGYGLYWRIVEMLHSDDTHSLPTKQYVIIAIAKQMLSTTDFVNKFLSDCINVFELFTQKNDTVICERVMRNIKHREDIKDKRKAAGSKGGVANAKQLLSKAKANSSKGKERKGKEIEDTTVSTGSAFEKFQDWISVNAKKVSEMSEPFTEKEHENLISDYNKEFIKDLLKEMHNYKNLVKGNTSANLTFRNWATRRGVLPLSKKNETNYQKRGLVL